MKVSYYSVKNILKENQVYYIQIKTFCINKYLIQLKALINRIVVTTKLFYCKYIFDKLYQLLVIFYFAK